MGEDKRVKVVMDKPSVDGVSRRKVCHRVVQKKGGSREEAAVPAPSINCVTSHGHICAPGSPAQQVHLQETGNWKEAQEQLVRYQLAGQDQLLLLCSDLRQERQKLQGKSQSPLGEESGSLGLSHEKKAPCDANPATRLYSVHPATIQEQL